MPHNCCVPLCHGKGYRTTTVDGKEAKITYHKLPDASKGKDKVELRRKWLHEIRRDVGMRSCSCMFRCTDTRLVELHNFI